MKKVLIALGSVVVLAFTGCGGANGVQSGSIESDNITATNDVNEMNDGVSSAVVNETTAPSDNKINDIIAFTENSLGINK